MRRNHEKTLSTGASPVARSAEHIYQAVRTVEMLNLRPSDDCSLRPAGAPKCYGLLKDTVPLGMVDACVFAADGKKIVTLPVDDSSATAPVVSGSLPSLPLCSLGRDGGMTVMTAEGAASIDVDGSRMEVKPLGSDFPPLTLIPSIWGKTSATIASRTLSRVYNTATPLTGSDAAAVTGDLASAYLRMCADAAAVGGMLQPVVARYKLRDSRGNLLFTSAPVLLGHPNGAQLADYVGIKSDDRMTLKSYSLEADLWSLSVKVHSSAGYARFGSVAQAEVWMTPMFHPYHPDMQGAALLARGSSVTEDFLRVTLPGVGCGLGSGRLGNVERLLIKALAHIDEIEECVAVIPSPFDYGARTVAVSLSADPDAASVSRRLSKALSKSVVSVSPLNVLLSAPHGFSARCCATDASVAAWGNLTVRRYAGYPLQSLAVKLADEAWSAVAVVRFADGSGVSRTESGSTGAPMAFSPLLCYPSADAVELKIVVTSGGTVRTHTLQLRPDASCRVSAFAGGGATPLSLVESAGVTLPALTAPHDRFAGAIAFAPADNPLAVDAVAEVEGAVNALAARCANDQSWEFGRGRFLAGSDSGVYSVAVAAGRKSLSVRRIAEGRVRRRDAMVTAAAGDVFVLCGSDAGSGPALLRILPSGRHELFEVPRDYRSLAWNGIAGELWACRADGSADVFCVAHGWRRYSRSDVDVVEFYNLGGEAYAVGGKGLLRLAAEEPLPLQHIKLSFLVNPDKLNAVRPGRLHAMLCCSSLFGELRLDGRNLAGTSPWPLLTVAFDGSCLSPLSLLPVGRPSRRLGLELEANVASDFVFDSFRISYYE